MDPLLTSRIESLEKNNAIACTCFQQVLKHILHCCAMWWCPLFLNCFFKPHPNYTYIHRLVGCYDLGKFFWSETIGPKATQMELYELISRTMTNPVILARNQPISRWFNGGMRTFAGGLKKINQKPSICATKY